MNIHSARPHLAQPPCPTIRPGHPDWEKASKGFNARISHRGEEPDLISFPRDETEIAGTLDWARKTGTEFRIRCGRHSYEGYSSVKDGLVLDVSELNDLNFEEESGRVTVGAGARVMDLAEFLSARGRVLPLPTFPSVGIAGATLGGGVGMASRKHGLTCDNLVSARVVLADGRLVTANEDENPDLFWALKGGGGGNFGVVTEFTFDTHPVENVALVEAEWPWEDFNRVVDAWQRWAPETDPNLTSALALTADGKLTLYGQYTPDGDEGMDGAGRTLAELLAWVPTDKASVTPVSPTIANRILGQLGPEDSDWRSALREEQIFKSSSAVALEPLPPEAIDTLRQAIENSPRRPGEKNQPDMVQLLSGGGRANSVDPTATAAYHRQSKFILQYDGYWDDPEDEDVNIQWVDKLREDMLPWSTGAYVNYHDSLLDDPLVAYYGPNLVRLAEVKKQYDPENVFHFAHSIPPGLTSEQREAALRAVSPKPVRG